MGRPPCKCNDGTFPKRRDVSYRTRLLAVWESTYLHLAPTIYMPSAIAIDTSLYGDANITLLGPYVARDAGVEIICCRKTVYVPATYVSLLLFSDQTPVEAWNRIWGYIVDGAHEAAYRLGGPGKVF